MCSAPDVRSSRGVQKKEVNVHDAKLHFLGDNDYTVWILYFQNFEDFVRKKIKKQLMNKTKWARRVSWITFFGYAQSQKIGKPNKLYFGATQPKGLNRTVKIDGHLWIYWFINLVKSYYLLY